MSISIILPVLNGEKYIRHCLEAVLTQTEKNFELVIVDDGSTDNTLKIIESLEIVSKLEIVNCKFNLIKNEVALGPWGNFEKQVRLSESKYCLLLCADVIIDKDFIKNALAIMEADETIGCLQAKIFQYNLKSANRLSTIDNRLIDTCGFQISKSRRVTNIGHGQIDNGQFNQQKEIFAVEGAVPFYRREAFLDCAVPVPIFLPMFSVPPVPVAASDAVPALPKASAISAAGREIVDHDMFWYGDDLDLGWRMNLFGWKQVYAPNVVAYHDRSTTKGISYHWWDYLARVKTRRQIPIRKRRLDWRNKRLARIKNDQWPNVWRHLPQILLREFSELIYIILIEPSVLLEMFNLIKLWPKMLNKRRAIMARAKRSAEEMKEWFI